MCVFNTKTSYTILYIVLLKKMNILTTIFIFLFVLFLYVHIIHQLKRSEDLEIYEMDYSTNANLQEVCDLKQPVLFDYQCINPEYFDNMNYDSIKNITSTNDIKVKEANDYWSETNQIDYVLLPIQSIINLTNSDTHSNYFTENNDEFVSESGLSNHFHTNDSFLKPTMTAITKYDINMGSKGVCTPLRYHTNYRQFMIVNSGKIKVKMTPWKSKKYLYPIKDYENYEFRSPINVWKTQQKYLHEMDKMRFLEFEVNAGYLLCVPPYWWYSISYSSDVDTMVTSITYNSIINCVVNLPHWGLYYLQQHNIKPKISKTLPVVNSSIDNNIDNENDAGTEPVVINEL